MDASHLLERLSNNLPESVGECHVVIKDLYYVVKELCLKVDVLMKENQHLKERLDLNSSNSSKPPSSDFNQSKKKRKNPRKSSGKPSGGQLGHRGHHRALEEVSAVDDIVICKVDTSCECCGKSAVTSRGDYSRHQVYELPPIKLRLTEYQLMKGICNGCGHRQQAPLPEGVAWGITGPRLTSLMSLLVSDYQLSRRQVQTFLQNYFHFTISLESVFNKQRLVNTVLETPVNDLLPIVTSSHCNMDETSHVRDGNLKRDFLRFSERKDLVISRIGNALLSVESQLFTLWYAYKETEMTREELTHRAKPLKKALGELLEQGSYTAPELRMSRFCKKVLKDFYALWTFLETEGVEPTNNHAERCLRPWVIWRKKYFGTRSDYGSEFVARTGSLKMTCQLQSKNTFTYLTQAITNYFAGCTAPPIISST